MDSVIKESKSNSPKIIVFDDTSFPHLDKPLSKERVKELEGTLGKALLARFKKELSDRKPNHKKD